MRHVGAAWFSRSAALLVPVVCAGSLWAQVYTPPTPSSKVTPGGSADGGDVTIQRDAKPDTGASPWGQEIPLLDMSAETVTVGGVTIPLGDNRVLRARFEKYLNQPEEDSEAARDYRDTVRKVLAEMAGALQGAGAQVLAIACNTAHTYADLISRSSGLPLIDMITTASVAARDTGARRAGVLGSRTALKLYREYLAAQGMGLVTLEPDRQAVFMDLVQKIKGGDRSREVRAEMAALTADLAAGGAETIIAGCTEVPLVVEAGVTRLPFIDSSETLARRCVAVCLGLEPLPA